MTLAFSFNTNGFAHHSLDDCLEILHHLGYDGVAITLDVHHLHPGEATPRDLDGLRRRLRDLGLRVAVETGARFLLDRWRKHHPGLLDPADSERRVRFLERAIEIAGVLGAECVTFASGPLDPSHDVSRALDLLARRCRRLAELAAGAGTVASFEPEPGFFVETLEQYRALRELVPGDAFGLTLDVGHAHLLESRDPGQCIFDHARDLRHVHLEDMRRPEHRHLTLGEGELAIEPVVSALRRIDYPGLVTLELSRDSHRAPEVAEDAIRRLRSGRS